MYGKLYIRLFIGLVLIVLSILILVSMFASSKKYKFGEFLSALSKKKEALEIDAMNGTGPNSTRQKQLMPNPTSEEDDWYAMHPNDALALAQKMKKAGVTVFGLSTCPATDAQRRLFGKEGSPARTLFESMYIECRHPAACPGIQSVPTWAFGEQKRPGNMNPEQISAFLDQAQYSTNTQMLQEPAEPVNGNIQGEQSAERHAFLPDPSIVAYIDAAVTQRVKTILEEKAKEEPAKEEGTKEAMRGLVPLADKPLDAVFAPGSASMVSTNDADRMMDAAAQGAPPRISMANRDLVEELAASAMLSISNAMNMQGSNGSLDSSSVNNSYLPHSTQITIGDPFVDNRM
jgi:hypothetical protein